ncbi:MAG: serine/threonine protein kinase [Bacteroides sp.]|nr:serine/threonine protein kinase [Bacteroides sp.]
MQLTINTELQGGKYQIIRVLGQGGFGITYLALHTMLDKQVAIKEFFPKEYCDRNIDTNYLTVNSTNSLQIVDLLKNKFIKEARNISKLNHPNIITIHDIFEEGNTAYYVMEYVEGHSLSELIKVNGRMPEGIALKYIKQIAGAIDYMHSLSMNHLDIKPANIMVREEDDEPILIDFGLSKQYDASGGQTSTTPVGISHGYAPAEQYRPGGVSTFTPQTDIYALGATLFNLLSGTIPPHYSEIIEDGVPELPSQVSRQTYEAIEKAMEIKKTKRPASIQDFLNLLNPTGITYNKTEQITENTLRHDNNTTNEEGLPVIPEIQNNTVIEAYDAKEEIYSDDTALLSTETSRTIESSDIAPDNKSDAITFIDLGLSVRWANKSIGIALPTDDKDVYLLNLNNQTQKTLPTYLEEGKRLPSIRNFEELLERCKWTSFRDNDRKGIKVTGPNGNSLIIPSSNLKNYLLTESLEPDTLGFIYLCHIDPQEHHLHKTPPLTSIIWPVSR